jgi:hypothetical protein
VVGSESSEWSEARLGHLSSREGTPRIIAIPDIVILA